MRLSLACSALLLSVGLAMPLTALADDAKRVQQHAAPVEHPARAVVVTINGTTLANDESARIIGGRVLVPMRSSFAALHLEVQSLDDRYIVHLSDASSLVLNRNSANGLLGARIVSFDTPVQNINGIVYVPLALFRSVFGAVTTYDSRNAHVAIVSALQAQAVAPDAPPPVQGTVSNIDAFSRPPVLAIVTDGSVRTIPLRSDVPVYVGDVVAGTRAKETLAAVHVGDIASVQFTVSGRVSEVDDSFRSRSGIVAALSSRALALGDGHLIMPSRDTTVSLNGQPISLDELKVGDAVTVRSNPESLEIREIIASRETGAPASAASVKITQCTFEPSHALRAHAELDVFLRGSAHGQASFDIGTSVVAVPMIEISPGLYRGTYLVAQGASFRNASVVGNLTVAGVRASAVTASVAFSAATLPPQVLETAPRDGQNVNNTRPSIYASFETPTGIDIDPNSISLFVSGRDVTSQAVRTKRYVTYAPVSDIASGATPVIVTVADVAGNVSTYRWTFTEGP